MVAGIIKKWDKNKDKLRQWFSCNKQKMYDEYYKIVDAICRNVLELKDYSITEVGHDNYQGVAVFIIKMNYGSYLGDYLITNTYYGSCSGCDTLMYINGSLLDNENLPTDNQLEQYMTLALHLVQKMQTLVDDEED